MKSLKVLGSLLIFATGVVAEKQFNLYDKTTSLARATIKEGRSVLERLRNREDNKEEKQEEKHEEIAEEKNE